MPKYTPWFSGDVKPVREGWYEVMGNFIEGRQTRRYWSGRGWMWRGLSGDEPLRVAAFSYKSDKWRGLTKEAKHA